VAKTWQKAKPTPKSSLRPKKRMLSVWWGVKGVIYWELLLEKMTINAILYHSQLKKIEAQVIEKGLNRGKMYFRHDNAKPHIYAEIVKEK